MRGLPVLPGPSPLQLPKGATTKRPTTKGRAAKSAAALNASAPDDLPNSPCASPPYAVLLSHASVRGAHAVEGGTPPQASSWTPAAGGGPWEPTTRHTAVLGWGPSVSEIEAILAQWREYGWSGWARQLWIEPLTRPLPLLAAGGRPEGGTRAPTPGARDERHPAADAPLALPGQVFFAGAGRLGRRHQLRARAGPPAPRLPHHRGAVRQSAAQEMHREPGGDPTSAPCSRSARRPASARAATRGGTSWARWAGTQ